METATAKKPCLEACLPDRVPLRSAGTPASADHKEAQKNPKHHLPEYHPTAFLTNRLYPGVHHIAIAGIALGGMARESD